MTHMTCEQFSILLDRYLEGSLNQQEREAFEAHAQTCADCQLLLQIRRDCQGLDDGGEVPASFSSSWRQAIHQQEGMNMEQIPETKKRAKPPINIRRWVAIAASLVLVLGGTWLVGQNQPRHRGATSEQTAYSDPYAGGTGLDNYMRTIDGQPAPAAMKMEADYAANYSAEASAIAPAPAAQNAPAQPQKMIRTVSLNLVTREFEQDLETLNAAIAKHGGYVEYSDVSADRGSRRYANLTIRIPKEQLDAYLADAQQVGRVTAYTESQEDVSERYADTATRLASQKAKMERLQQLLKQAITVKDILEIENQIADTQYQLDSLTGALRGMDSKVDYSTVRLSLQEEVPTASPTELTLGQRIGLAMSDAWEAIQSFLEDLVVLLAVALPYVLALAVVILIVRFIIKRRKNK